MDDNAVIIDSRGAHLMKSGALARLALGLITYATIGVALFGFGTPVHDMTKSGGLPAYLSLAVLSLATTAVLWDVFWNDLWKGSPCPSEITKTWRQYLWMLISVTYIAYLVIMVKTGTVGVQGASFLAYGLGGVAIAFNDVLVQIRDV